MARIVDASGRVAHLDIEYDMQERQFAKVMHPKVPRRTGLLRTSLRTFSRKRNTLQVTSKLPYARPVHEGADVPPFDITTKRGQLRPNGQPYRKVMKAVIGGQIRYFTKRKGFRIVGQPFVDQTVDDPRWTPIPRWA